VTDQEKASPLAAAVVIVSFNTKAMLRDCLKSVFEEAGQMAGAAVEVHVVDNASKDGSPEMVEREFPAVRLTRSAENLGFGAANNVALRTILDEGRARYIILLNSDAFPQAGAFFLALRMMDATPEAGCGGARLVYPDGRDQPSARRFHSLLDDAMVATGLAGTFPKSRFFGRAHRTWADAGEATEADWIPGAFMILRPEALRQVGLFDERFFLYYEEVDLCRRLWATGWKVWYWPEIVVTHVCGESARTVRELDYASREAQVVQWRMRSTLLYYRKHHGPQARLAMLMEQIHNLAIRLRNAGSEAPERRARAARYATMMALMRDAWRETQGGRVSPPRPW
jgi:GT2 family glycosyltransferase